MKNITETLVAQPLALQLIWEDDTLHALRIQWSTDLHHNVTTSDGKKLQKALEHYVQGKPVVWPELPFNWAQCSSFARNVLQVLYSDVGWGELISYAGLAELSGCKGAARGVGSVMRTNPWPLVIPCHRVIGQNKKLTGYGGGLDMKRYLLEKEKSWPL